MKCTFCLVVLIVIASIDSKEIWERPGCHKVGQCFFKSYLIQEM